jgi:CRP/FNR family cyclic AMP-dependent transcriptional regulator
MLPKKELTARVARIPLFSTLDQASLETIARLVSLRHCSAREHVVWEGDPSGALFLIISGHYKAFSTSPDGKELVFSLMGPGEVFGELGVLDGEPRSATVVALEAGHLGVIEQQPLLDVLHSSPALTIQIAKGLCQRVRALSKRYGDVTMFTVPARLARLLLTLVHLSQELLGSMVGATRESVNKQLVAWTDAGILSKDERCIVILDPETLREHAEA